MSIDPAYRLSLRAQILRKLTGLGDSAKAVARSLQKLGITGWTGHRTECPIGVFLSRYFPGFKFTISPELIQVFHLKTYDLFRFVTPPVIQEFLRDFDHKGHFPFLLRLRRPRIRPVRLSRQSGCWYLYLPVTEREPVTAVGITTNTNELWDSLLSDGKSLKHLYCSWAMSEADAQALKTWFDAVPLETRYKEFCRPGIVARDLMKQIPKRNIQARLAR